MKFVSVDPSLSNTAIVWGEIVDGKIKNISICGIIKVI